MLAAPPTPVLEALTRQEDQNDFREIIAWLQAARDRQSYLNDRLRDLVTLRHGQGAAQVLTDLLDIMTSAHDTLIKQRADR